jgi:phage tail protein X
VVDGQCESQCIDVPADVLQALRTSGITSTAVMAWLQAALGLPSAKGLLPQATLNVLPDGSGYFFHTDFPGIVRFSLPLVAAQEEMGAD